jgi:hypothetical protein
MQHDQNVDSDHLLMGLLLAGGPVSEMLFNQGGDCRRNAAAVHTKSQ